jgi:threonine dehydrogenase-like Zn-dependent dehydrogenase
VVLVAVYAFKPEVDLFRFFWRELELRGARVYEGEDYDEAIRIAASGALPLDKLITETTDLEGLQSGFEKMDAGGECMKILVDVRA